MGYACGVRVGNGRRSYHSSTRTRSFSSSAILDRNSSAASSNSFDKRCSLCSEVALGSSLSLMISLFNTSDNRLEIYSTTHCFNQLLWWAECSHSLTAGEGPPLRAKRSSLNFGGTGFLHVILTDRRDARLTGGDCFGPRPRNDIFVVLQQVSKQCPITKIAPWKLVGAGLFAGTFCIYKSTSSARHGRPALPICSERGLRKGSKILATAIQRLPKIMSGWPLDGQFERLQIPPQGISCFASPSFLRKQEPRKVSGFPLPQE